MPARTLFVGLGSPQGDDLAGWQVADGVSKECADTRELSVRRAALPLDLLDWLEGIERLALCDACQGGGSPGHWQSWTWPNLPVERLRVRGSHDFGVAAVLDLAARLGRLPAEVQVWGIELSDASYASDPSPAVARAVTQVIADVCRVLLLPRKTCHA
ncbi:MAG: hydrogenase maturation protease [Planctomycetales bacterium]